MHAVRTTKETTMPICRPCRVPHNPEMCEDTQAGRTGLARTCFCQHKPYRHAPSEQVTTGPEDGEDT